MQWQLKSPFCSSIQLLVDSEAIILVNPANVEAVAYIEGFPEVNIDVELDTNGSYIFIAHEDVADQFGIILGFPIAPGDIINTGMMMSENFQVIIDEDHPPSDHERQVAEELAQMVPDRIVRVRGSNTRGPDYIIIEPGTTEEIYWDVKQVTGTSDHTLPNNIDGAKGNFTDKIP